MCSLNSPSAQSTVFHSWRGFGWSDSSPQTSWKVGIWGRSRGNSQNSASGCRKLLCPKAPSCLHVPSPLFKTQLAARRTASAHDNQVTSSLLDWEGETCPVERRKWSSPVSKSWGVVKQHVTWCKCSCRAAADSCAGFAEAPSNSQLSFKASHLAASRERTLRYWKCIAGVDGSRSPTGCCINVTINHPHP